MKFFIPDIESPEKAEELYEATRKFAYQNHALANRTGADSKHCVQRSWRGDLATVGEREPSER